MAIVACSGKQRNVDLVDRWQRLPLVIKKAQVFNEMQQKWFGDLNVDEV